MTETFVVFSFYGYFVLFLLVEFVLTRSRLGAKEQGNRDLHANPTWLQWGLGWAIGLTGFAIRIIAKRTLGRFYTVRVQMQEGHEVIDTGIYGLVRHPLYLGIILEWIAPPLILGSPWGFLFTTIWMVIGVLQRIPWEEKMLVEGLGEKYRTYMGRTKRLIPGVW